MNPNTAPGLAGSGSALISFLPEMNGIDRINHGEKGVHVNLKCGEKVTPPPSHSMFFPFTLNPPDGRTDGRHG